MRVLIVHNTLWAHYKSLLFSRLASQMQPADALLVVQIALTEGHRAGLGVPDAGAVGYPFALLHNGPLEAVSLPQRIRGLLKHGLAFNPDVVLLTGYYDPAQVLLGLMLKARGCRIVLQTESTAQDSRRTGWREAMKRAFVRNCDGYFCFGNRAADYLIELGAKPDQILVRNNAVVDNALLRRLYEAALPSRPDRQRTHDLRPRNLIYVGRLASEKNLIALLNAFAEATKTDTAGEWGLLFLGEGDQKTELQQRTQQLNLTDRVRFLPGCGWQDVPTYLALADALVLPSLSEPWGLVVNEAMACGLPVLVSDRCGCADDLVREGHNGYRFDPTQPAQLTARITRLMATSPAELSRMGDESARIVDHYDPGRVGRAMYDSLKQLTTI